MMMQIRRSAVIVVGLTLLTAFVPDAQAGSIVVSSRESAASLSVFAGSGGAVSQDSDEASLTDLNGNFSFSNSLSAAITPADFGSNGEAGANAAVVASDSVVSTPTTLSILAGRASTGSAIWISGTGNGLATIITELQVDFSVVGDPAAYTLRGDFNPGAANGVGQFRIGRPFASFDIIDLNNNAAVFDDAGLLAPNDYRFRVRLVDQMSANANNESASDQTSYNIDFQLVSLPEPGSLLLLSVALATFTHRRR